MALDKLYRGFGQVVRRLRTNSPEASDKQFQKGGVFLKLIPPCCHCIVLTYVRPSCHRG